MYLGSVLSPCQTYVSLLGGFSLGIVVEVVMASAWDMTEFFVCESVGGRCQCLYAEGVAAPMLPAMTKPTSSHLPRIAAKASVGNADDV